MITHISYSEHNSCSKVNSKKNQDGGRCRLKKLSNATSQQLFTDFDEVCCHDATATSIPDQCIHRGMTPQKVTIFFQFLRQESAKSANKRLHAKLVKYSNFYDISANV